jgi:hypothetical protein
MSWLCGRGCLTYHGVDTSAMINGNMNSVTYIETLKITFSTDSLQSSEDYTYTKQSVSSYLQF